MTPSTTPPSENQRFAVGDRVLHAGKPEWGAGSVTKAEGATHDGAPCQRLTVRFARAGLKTLSTAFAKLRHADDTPAIDRARDAAKAALLTPDPPADRRPSKRPPPGMAGPAEAPPDDGPPVDPAAARELMTQVPEDARDPFRPTEDRLKTTLALYRYTNTGGSLLDWAATQSGLADPLSLFSRHELEQFFDRFQIELGHHLGKLLAEARRAGIDTEKLLRAAPPAAQRAVQRGNARR